MVYLLFFFEVLVHVPGLGHGVLVLDIGNQFAFTVACSLNGLDSNLHKKICIDLYSKKDMILRKKFQAKRKQYIDFTQGILHFVYVFN